VRIAFHAPLKPPDAIRPSGDRRMARLLVRALEGAGHTVDLASRLRTRDAQGDVVRQARIAALGERLVARYVGAVVDGRRPRPDLWFTYHLYYKAPDRIGPAVAGALSIPYVVAEASVAHKRAGGPWDSGHRAVLDALGRAALVIGFNNRDAALVGPTLGDDARYVHLRPFLNSVATPEREASRQTWADRSGLDRDVPWLLAVGMMRPGDKTASYQVLGGALARLVDRPWRLLVVGDGDGRPAVAATLAPIADRVHWAGVLAPDALAEVYAAGDLFVWPAIREAYGMALLEAQAAGLPAVAGDVGGVSGILRDGITGLLAPEGDARAFADRVAQLLDDPVRRREMSIAARRVMAAEHTLDGAAATLDDWLRPLVRAGA